MILTLGGITGLVPNLPITTTGGFRYRVDIAIPEHKIFIEYQSDQFHSGTRRQDLTRSSRLHADEWFGIEVSADDLDDPAELCTRIRRIVARRPS